MNKRLIVIRDSINSEDRGSDMFLKVIIGEGRRNDVEIIVLDDLDKVSKHSPMIALQP